MERYWLDIVGKVKKSTCVLTNYLLSYLTKISLDMGCHKQITILVDKTELLE